MERFERAVLVAAHAGGGHREVPVHGCDRCTPADHEAYRLEQMALVARVHVRALRRQAAARAALVGAETELKRSSAAAVECG